MPEQTEQPSFTEAEVALMAKYESVIQTSDPDAVSIMNAIMVWPDTEAMPDFMSHDTKKMEKKVAELSALVAVCAKSAVIYYNMFTGAMTAIEAVKSVQSRRKESGIIVPA